MHCYVESKFEKNKEKLIIAIIIIMELACFLGPYNQFFLCNNLLLYYLFLFYFFCKYFGTNCMSCCTVPSSVLKVFCAALSYVVILHQYFYFFLFLFSLFFRQKLMGMVRYCIYICVAFGSHKNCNFHLKILHNFRFGVWICVWICLLAFRRNKLSFIFY